jgi:membrane-bound serine protease (ClpP class)
MLGDTAREGWANVGGETWRVVSSTPLSRAQKVRVLARRGPVLEVAPFDNHA